MITIDDTALLAGLDKLLLHIPAQAEKGLARQAGVAESEMKATTAHGDITGATRDSYRAFLIGGTHTGASESASGYAAAQAAIASSTVSHGGAAISQDSGVALSPDERGVLITAYTTQQYFLETTRAGERAVLLPTLQQNAQAFTQAVASEGL